MKVSSKFKVDTTIRC